MFNDYTRENEKWNFLHILSICFWFKIDTDMSSLIIHIQPSISHLWNSESFNLFTVRGGWVLECRVAGSGWNGDKIDKNQKIFIRIIGGVAGVSTDICANAAVGLYLYHLLSLDYRRG